METLRDGLPRRPTPGPARDESPGTRFGWKLSLVAVGLVAVLTVTLLMARREPEHSEARDPGLIAAAVEAYSAGNIVLPGGESAPVRPATGLRGTATDSVSTLVEAAWKAYMADPTRADRGIEALAGLLAIGKTGLAGDRLGLYRRDHPEDPNAFLLEAVMSYEDGHPDEAKMLLRRVASDYPARVELAELNLGIILRDTGDGAAADRMFRRLAGEARDERIRRRAAQEIEHSQ